VRALQLSDANRAEVKRVVDFAVRQPNWYIVPSPQKAYLSNGLKGTPGDHPQYTTILDSYRCVFTISAERGRLFRHLSISVPGDYYPNEVAAFSIAQLFGFTGWDLEGFLSSGKVITPPPGWLILLDKQACAIVFAQPLHRHQLPP
jgi:hypothetical protein